jgi:hypothetical protein
VSSGILVVSKFNYTMSGRLDGSAGLILSMNSFVNVFIAKVMTDFPFAHLCHFVCTDSRGPFVFMLVVRCLFFLDGSDIRYSIKHL